MLHEEIQLPHQLVAIERDSVGDVFGRSQLRAFPLHAENELDRLPVQRIVFGRLSHAEVRLQGDVAEILQDEDAKVVGMARDSGNRQRNVREEPAHVDERQLVECERRVRYRQHDRRIVRPQDTEILARRGVACQRHDAYLRPRESRALQALVDPRASVLKRWRSSFHHLMSATTSSPSL